MANTRREEVNAPEMTPRQIELQRAFATPSEAGGASVGGAADSAAAGFTGAAKLFGQISDQIGKYADEVAIDKGLKEGAIAGFDPEFRPKGDLTLYAKAYDKAAIETYKGQMQVNLAGQLEKAYDANKDNPAKLATAMQGIRQGWMENIDRGLAPHVLPDFEATFNRKSLELSRASTREQLARAAETQQATLLQSLTQHLRSIDQAAYHSGLDEAADAALAGEVAAYKAKLSQRGADGKFLIEPKTQATMLRQVEEQASTGRLYAAFERLPSIDEKVALAKKFDDDFRNGTGAAAKLDLPQFLRIKGHFDHELRRAEAMDRQGHAELADVVKKVGKMAEEGFAPSKQELAALDAKVAMSGRSDLVAGLADARDEYAWQKSARSMSQSALESEVNDHRRVLQNESANPTAIRRLKSAETLLSHMQKELVTNPVGWANKVGRGELEPMHLDSANPAATSVWGSRRIAQAEDVAKFHNLPKPVYLEPVEKRRLAKAFEQGGTEGLAAIRNVQVAFGDRAEAVLTELGHDAPVGAALGKLALAAPTSPAVLDAAEGLALKKRDGYKPLAPHESKTRPEAASIGGTAFAQAPEYLSSAMRVADAIYETRANREGKREAFEPKIWRQAFSEALGETKDANGRVYGGIVKPGGLFSGHRIVIPPSIAQDKASATFAAIEPDDLGAAFGDGPRYDNGRMLTRQELRSATLVTLAPGRYLVATGNPTGDNPGWAKGPDGKAYVLDMEKALPAIRRRRPDLR